MTREGEMSNPAFAAWIEREVNRRLASPSKFKDKKSLLHALLEENGARSLFEVGLTFSDIANNPVIDTLIEGKNPLVVFKQWMRFERFCHTHNRIAFEKTSPNDSPYFIILKHFALDEFDIAPVNHLFIWGVLTALMLRAGFTDFQVSLGQKKSTLIYADGVPQLGKELPLNSCLAHFQWQGPPSYAKAASRSSTERKSQNISQAVDDVIESSLSLPWKLSEVARRMGKSPRSLQRALQMQNTTFSERLLQTRLKVARNLMKNDKLNLTEIAFCAGFSDLAHFSRSARRELLITASDFRTLI